mgnify:CR=1 FL=1
MLCLFFKKQYIYLSKIQLQKIHQANKKSPNFLKLKLLQFILIIKHLVTGFKKSLIMCFQHPKKFGNIKKYFIIVFSTNNIKTH